MTMWVPRSTDYRWLRRKERQGLKDDAGGGNPPWNRLTSREVDCVLSAAREMPELSCRQLAAWTTDNIGFSVSESTVYRVLRREGLVKRPETRLAAGKEYHRKTTGPSPDVGHRCLLLQGGGLGLLLPGHRDGRLLPFHPLSQASTRHDIRLLRRGGPGCGGQDRHGSGPNDRPDQAAERRRCGSSSGG